MWWLTFFLSVLVLNVLRSSHVYSFSSVQKGCLRTTVKESRTQDISWSAFAWWRMLPFKSFLSFGKVLTIRPYIQDLSKATLRVPKIIMKLYQSLHQNDEEYGSEELNFRMEFRMVQNASQRQHHVFHMMPHIQREHQKTKVNNISLFTCCHTH